MLREHCSVNDNIGDNVFVGIDVTPNSYKVTFPLGYSLAEKNEDVRKDILLLISVLKSNTDKKESRLINEQADKYENIGLPIQSYLYVINDFFNRGYYVEKEVIYSSSKKGKINWSRTIKHIKPVVQDTDIFYLDFITKKNTLNENRLLTLIHKYCVYIAFSKIGWLFCDFIPPKPKVVYNQKLFTNVLVKKLANTFNDDHRTLFRNLLAIIKESSSYDSDCTYRFGTTVFSAVWEKMINRVFGVDDLNKYYPHAVWCIGSEDDTADENAISLDSGETVDSKLRPDSIMIPCNQSDRKIYILDAKYYKYGDLRYRDKNNNVHYMNEPSAKRLPHSADINKQITYGEYIAEMDDAPHGEKHPIVYNAFVMPFDNSLDYWKKKKQEVQFVKEPSHLHWIGEAKSKWKKNNKPYERIQGILLDVKHIMMLDAQQDENEILQLANLIEERCVEGLKKDNIQGHS